MTLKSAHKSDSSYTKFSILRLVHINMDAMCIDSKALKSITKVL